MKPKITEADVTRSIRQLLKQIGVFHWKVHQGLGCVPGVPDVIGVWKGRLLGIEVKRPGGKLSPAQVAFIDRINAEGGLAFVAFSVDDVMRELGIKDRFLI